MSFVLLVVFALIMFFQPWAKHFEDPKDLTYDEYATLEEEPTQNMEKTAEVSEEL